MHGKIREKHEELRGLYHRLSNATYNATNKPLNEKKRDKGKNDKGKKK